MRRSLLICCAFTTYALPVFSQSVCDVSLSAIEDNLKSMAFAGADLGGGPQRESVRRSEQIFYASLIHSNLIVLQANKCPMPKGAISQSAYREVAVGCVLALSKSTGTTTPAECDRSTWTRK